MSTASLVRAAAACGVALAAGSALPARAAIVNLGDWAYGDSWSHVVDVGAPAYRVPAGAFKGAVKFAADGEQGFTGTITNFVTYCVELDQSFPMPSGNMSGYSVVAGADYARWNGAGLSSNTAAATSERLGQLLSYVGANPGLVDDASESTSLQLAIWNLIYDGDASVTSGLFRETSGSAYDGYATQLLADAGGWSGVLDVYVLAKDGSQDFLLTRDGGRRLAPADLRAVPEPATALLAAVALGGVALVRRRR
jgi:hypothetical protein